MRATADRAFIRDGVLVLPAFSLLGNRRVPNNARVVARNDVANEHGALITYTVYMSRRRNAWWIAASRQGLRMSNTAKTTKKDVAQTWIDAVERGAVVSS